MEDEKTWFYSKIKTNSTVHCIQVPSEVSITLQYFDIKIPSSVCTLLDLLTSNGC